MHLTKASSSLLLLLLFSVCSYVFQIQVDLPFPSYNKNNLCYLFILQIYACKVVALI